MLIALQEINIYMLRDNMSMPINILETHLEHYF